MVREHTSNYHERGDDMTKQLHNRMTDEHVDAILSRYIQKKLNVVQAMGMLGLLRSQFFAYVKKYKDGCRDFTIAYARTTGNHTIDTTSEEYIMKELEMEKALIDDPSMPVRFYNYSFIRDQIMQKYHQEISVPTIIDRANKKRFLPPEAGKETPRSRAHHQLCRGIDPA